MLHPGVDLQGALKSCQGTPEVCQLHIAHAHPSSSSKVVRVELQHELAQLDALLVLVHEVQHCSTFVVSLQGEGSREGAPQWDSRGGGGVNLT